MDNIQNIYDLLNWRNNKEKRSEGIRLAKNIKDLSLLITPPAPPSVWECCADILFEKTDSELEPYLLGLLEWLQDLNWPGAQTILDRLLLLNGGLLYVPFLQCFHNAHEQMGDEGLRWLDYLSELLDNKLLKSHLPDDVLRILSKHYKNWGFWCQDAE